MVARLESDVNFGKKTGAEIVLLLERLDAIEKAALVGRAFRAYAKGFVDAETLQRMIHAIDRIMLRDLRQVPTFLQSPNSVSDRTRQALVYAGLAKLVSVSDFGAFGGFSALNVVPDESLCAGLVKHVLT